MFFLTANVLMTSSTLRFLVLWMCNNDKFDNLSSTIVALRQFFMRRITLNERSLDAEDTGIVINTAYILEYKFWFVTLSFSSNVCGFFPSTIFQRVFHLATSSRNACLSPISVRKESKIELVVWSFNVWSYSAYLFKHFIQSSNFKFRPNKNICVVPVTLK